MYNWIHAIGAAWGITPTLDETGQQCITPAAVDAAVRNYWVDTVRWQHAGLDEEARWDAFLSSSFGPCITIAHSHHVHWDGPRVKAVMWTMKETVAPGTLGIAPPPEHQQPSLWNAPHVNDQPTSLEEPAPLSVMAPLTPSPPPPPPRPAMRMALTPHPNDPARSTV